MLIEKGADLNVRSDYGNAADQIIILAVERKLPQFVKILADHGADLNRLNIFGYNALHHVAKTGNVEMIEVLLKMGCLIDCKSFSGDTALQWALRAGQSGAARYLFAHGAEVKMSNNEEVRYFENAFSCGCEDIAFKIMSKSEKQANFIPALIKFKKFDTVMNLIKSADDPDYKINGVPLISIAAGEGAVDLIKELIDKQANIEIRSGDGRTPLLYAARMGKMDAVKFLAANGADCGARDKDRNTALILAALSGNCTAVKYFEGKGQSVNCQNRNGLTPLIAACIAGNAETVSYIISRGASCGGYYANPSDVPGGPLLYASRTRNSEIVKSIVTGGADLKSFAAVHALCDSLGRHSDDGICMQLIEFGVDLNKSSDYTDYPLYWGVKFMKNKAVKLMIKKGARFDLSESKSIKVIGMEKEFNNPEIFSILRKASAEVSKYPAIEKTAALNRAITAGATAEAMVLLKESFEVDLRDERYCTPLFTAVETGSVAIVEALLRRGADPNMSGRKDLKPLTLAVRSKKIELVKLLVNGGANIDFTDDFNTLLLVASVINNSADIFEFLTACGAGIDLCSNDGHTPLTAAAACGRVEMVKTLLDKGADAKKRNRMCDTAITTA
ncbi:MAG: hypothetical protein ACD_47C00305G0001, partial [uncultured bacterium]